MVGMGGVGEGREGGGVGWDMGEEISQCASKHYSEGSFKSP